MYGFFPRRSADEKESRWGSWDACGRGKGEGGKGDRTMVWFVFVFAVSESKRAMDFQ